MLKRNQLLLLFLFLWGVLFQSCSTEKNEKVAFTVLGTSDIHGAFFPYDLTNDRKRSTSLAQVYSYVQEKRKAGEVILLDNGDILQGDPLVYYSNFEKPQQAHICSEVMNYMQYDAACIGNHDIETGHQVYDRLNKAFNFPWLAANAVRNSDEVPYFKPYTILHKGGAKVAVLGLITPAVPQWLPEQIWEGMHFEPMVSTAQKWIKIIQEKEQPDFVIGVFHSGAGKDGEKPDENASLEVAQKVTGFDMVICGHDHRENISWIENPQHEKVLVINPKNRASYLAEVQVSMEWDKDAGKYDKILKPNLVEVWNLEASEDYIQKFQPMFDQVKDYVARPIGRFSSSISTKEAMFGDSPFMDLIHRIQLDLTGADISLAAPLSFNASIDSGDLYVRDLFNLYRFENLLYTMNLSGQEIKDFLEYSYKNWFQQMSKASDPMLFIHSTEKGNRLSTRFYNYDDAEGINYTLDLTKGYGERIQIKKLANGETFHLDKMYKVALNSYRGNGGGGHLTAGSGLSKQELTDRLVTATDKDLRYYLMKWIEKKGEINTPCNHSWNVIPENWYEEAKARELKLLYPIR